MLAPARLLQLLPTLQTMAEPSVWVLFALMACAALDVGYCTIAALFVRMWGEGMPSALILSLSLVRRLLFWVGLILMIVGLEVKDDFVLAALISLVAVLVAYRGVKETSSKVVQGGPPPDVSALKDKKLVIVITGANTGIGMETVQKLSTSLGAESTIFLLCRSVSKGEGAVESIRLSTQSRRCCQLRVVQCDLTSFTSIRKCVETILETNSIIDMIINNAGVMMKDLSYTADGHEVCLQANFLGHVLLTALLLPHITTAIINLTSSTYHLAVSTFDEEHLDDLQCKSDHRTYSLFGQYAATKWCNILHTVYLAESYDHLISAAIHPGLVRTDVVRNMPWYLRLPNEIFAVILQTLQKTPAQGAWCTLFVVAESFCLHNDSNGQYWVNRQPQTLSVKSSVVQRQAAAVWEWATRQVGLSQAELERLQAARSSSSTESAKAKKLQ